MKTPGQRRRETLALFSQSTATEELHFGILQAVGARPKFTTPTQEVAIKRVAGCTLSLLKPLLAKAVFTHQFLQTKGWSGHNMRRRSHLSIMLCVGVTPGFALQ